MRLRLFREPLFFKDCSGPWNQPAQPLAQAVRKQPIGPANRNLVASETGGPHSWCMTTDIGARLSHTPQSRSDSAAQLWIAIGLSLLAATASACKKEVQISPDEAKFQTSLQEELIQARGGAIIRLPAGTFRLSRTLTVSGKDKITIRGAGMDKTVLSFKGQKIGAEGIKATGNNFVIEDLTIQDTKGDALKIEKSQGVTIRRVKTEWTRGPHESNGAYGIYPVQCENILIEESVAIGASDAGIYVGQSKNIVVRRNRAELNVAGIEIENSTFADVYENTATKNTGGILVFDLPDLDVQGGRNTRVFKNKVIGNNTDNFAPSGNIVASVPPGTGVMVMANDEIEIFENDISDHDTTNMAIVSYFVTNKKIDRAKKNNKNYDAYPEAIFVHNNRFGKSGDNPRGLLIKILALKMGKPFPDILYDGILDSGKLKAGRLPDDKRVCIKDNGTIRFANIDAANNFKDVKRDLQPHACEHEPLKAIHFPGVS